MLVYSRIGARGKSAAQHQPRVTDWRIPTEIPTAIQINQVTGSSVEAGRISLGMNWLRSSEIIASYDMVLSEFFTHLGSLRCSRNSPAIVQSYQIAHLINSRFRLGFACLCSFYKL